MINIEDKLTELGLTLPEISIPGGTYVSVNIRENIAYVAIQFPILNNEYLFRGKLGTDITTEDGYKAAQLSALNILSQIHHKVGLENIIGLNHLDIYYQCSVDWDDAPIIANGASDLFVNVLAERGQHSRAIFGVLQLPRNFCVGITSSWTIK